MRFQITLRNFGPGSLVRIVSQEKGIRFLEALAAGTDVLLNGEFYNRTEVLRVEKLNEANFGWRVAIDNEAEEWHNPIERKYLEAKGVKRILTSPAPPPMLIAKP